MPNLAELVDAVIGADTHRDTHTRQMCTPAGGDDLQHHGGQHRAGFTDALTWVAEHAPVHADRRRP